MANNFNGDVPRRQCYTDVSAARPPLPHEARASQNSMTGSTNRVFFTLPQNVDNQPLVENGQNDIGTLPAEADDKVDGERFDSNELREIPQDPEPQDQQNGGAVNLLDGALFSAPIDPLPETNQMMDPHGSYHYEISGEEAEFRLKAFQTRSYLTRYSAFHKRYILSVYQPVPRRNEIKHEIRHFAITFKLGDRKIYQITDREFNSLETMLETYEREKVDHSLPNIGRMVSEADHFLRLRQQQQVPQQITMETFIEQQLAQQHLGLQGQQENNEQAQPVDDQIIIPPEPDAAHVQGAAGGHLRRVKRCLIS